MSLVLAKSIDLPKKLLWDYKRAPSAYLWRLQRVADYFPLYGRDRKTVRALYENLKKLKIDETTKLLIKEYEKAWEKKSGKNKK